jgi:hypothetical protein
MLIGREPTPQVTGRARCAPGSCSALTNAIASADALLNTIGFDGNTSYSTTMTASQRTQANTLAGILDRYNNVLCH